MSKDSNQPLVSLKGFFTVTFLSVLFFLLMLWVLLPHVPSQNPKTVLIVSSMTSICMTGVFWIAGNMLWVTWIDYNRKKHK
tara:strand:+ start:187 stop:429 length:243 start_codon:yes stop_codon:yes gene_type:complete